MKKIFITFSLLVALAAMTISCQKELVVESTSITSDVMDVWAINYSIDGTSYKITLYGEEQRNAFLDSMMTLAEQGCHVVIVNQKDSPNTDAVKDVQTLETKDREEAMKWVDDMSRKGYKVDYYYEDGVYYCTAIC